MTWKLGLLGTLADQITVPRAVADEVSAKPDGGPTLQPNDTGAGTGSGPITTDAGVGLKSDLLLVEAAAAAS